ncbi:DnaT-like ssDNA-binding domain-containing protein [Serratia marcescens]
MRDYGKVHTSFWISDGMRQVSDDARLLALYLLTGQHTNMIGCFRLPDGYVSEDLGWPFERVSKGFDELSNNGFATRDSTSKWVLIRNFMEWNTIDNPNQGISALRLFTQVPDNTSLKPVLARVLANAISHIDAAKLKGSERVIKPFLNQEQEQEQEQKNKTPHNAHGRESELLPDDSPFPMFDGWLPKGNLPKEYAAEELDDFILFWSSGGQAFNQAQWEQKFSRSVQRYREHVKTQKSGGQHAKQNPPPASAFEQVRTRHNEWRVSQGLAPLGDDGGDICQPLGEQERGSAIHDLGPDDFEILG